ncbi:MAG: PAS domain S-box protein [Armatimonadota bacterium]
MARSVLLRYGVALGASSGSVALALWARPFLPDLAGPVLLTAVTISAWYGGLWPGLLATTIAALGFSLLVLPPYPVVEITAPQTAVQLSVYGLLAVLMSLLHGRRWLTHHHARQLVAARAELLSRERVAEQRYRDLVQGVNGIVWEAGPDTGLTFLSEQAEELLEISIPEWLAERRLCTDFVHPDERERVRKELLEAFRSARHVELEYRADAPSGRRVWLRDRVTLLRDESGAVCQLRGLLVDVTEHVEAEETLRKSEEWYRRIVDTAFEGIWLLDSDLRTAYANQRLCEMLGYSSREILTRPMTDFLYEEDREELPRKLERFPLGVHQQFDFRLRRRDGTALWVLGSMSAIEGESGQRLGTLGMLTDVTKRRRAEGALRFLAEASSALGTSLDYQSTLERVSQLAVPELADWCIVDMVDHDGALLRLAVAHADPDRAELAASLRGRYRAPEGSACGVCRVLASGNPELVFDASDAVLEALATAPEHAETFRELNLRSYFSVPLVARGRTLGVMTFAWSGASRRCQADDLAQMEDLARRAAIAIDNARLYGELRQADRSKDEFLAMLAHELRNPLAAVSNALEVMRSSPADSPAHRRASDVVERQLRHQVRLVDDLLDVSRISRGKVELRRQPVNLLRLVRETAEDHRRLLEANGLSLTLELPESAEPLWIEGDPTRLAQVLGNLLNNAVKFTDRGGCVAVRVWHDTATAAAIISVRDTGIGIETEMLPHVFEPFSQADRSLDRSRGGLGLGLALVQGLTQLHGGEVTVRSRGLGAGSEFSVRLPLLAQPDASAVPDDGTDGTRRHAPAREMAADAPLRVLIVEDNVDAAETLQDILSLAGYEPHLSHSGTAGVEAARRLRPDVVLCDIGLPGMDGHAVARALRADPATRSARLIALSGYGRPEDLERSAAAGFELHLTKPVNPAALRRVIEDGTVPTGA